VIFLEKTYENYAYVLEYLPQGYSTSKHKEKIAQIVGCDHFSLLEVVPKEDLATYEKIFVGNGKRDKISHVKKKIGFDELTSLAKSELPRVLEKIVEEEQERFLKLFNEAKPLTIRFHQLELLSGIGKKLMNEILVQRKARPFESFEELKHRIPTIPDPKKMIAKRIYLEIEDKDASAQRYKAFVH